LVGDIFESEKAEFENYLSVHPEKQKEAELFRLTKLQPDLSIVFGRKNKLYRHSAGRTILLWTMHVAAVIIVALSVYIFIDKSANEIIPENQIAVIEKEPEKKINPSEIKEVPTKNNKAEEQKTVKKELDKPSVKSEKPKANETKIIRENSQGRLINDDLALVRISEEMATLNSVTASITTFLNPNTDLVPVKLLVPDYTEQVFEERLLVDLVKEKTRVDEISMNKIVKAGLSLVSSISKEKFNYETNTEGKVTEVNFDSRLLAFSIPTKTEEKVGE